MLLVEKVLQQNPLMEVKNWFLYAFEIKAGSKPVENIDSIQIYIKSIQLESSSFKAEIVEEDMNVKLYFVNLRPTAIVPISTNIFTNYTENHLNNKAHDIKQIEFLSRLQLQALAHIFEDGQKSIFTGLQSNHQYLTSLLDWLVVFAQMGEILAYHYDNLKRDESGNFWMRKIKAKFLTNTLPKIGDNIPVFAEITDTNMIKLNREEWRTFSMAGYNNAKTIVFVAKVAHKLPKKLTRQGGSK